MFFYVTSVLPFACLLAILWLGVSPSRSALITAVLLSTLTLLVWCSFMWLLRDGLGPDSVSSTGIEAWQRFFDGALKPLGIWNAAMFASFGSYWFGHKRRVSAA